jgi:hypothetical protein
VIVQRIAALLLAVIAIAGTGGMARGAVFQYTMAVETAKGTSSAFLWIPPHAEVVRGVVVAGMTLAERDIVQDAQIRRACEDQQLAILFFKCGLSAVDLQKTLDEFSKESGYGEIAGAPLFFIGHSAGGPQAKSLAIKLADRCFGLMLYRGGVPGGEESVPAGVPLLLMIGQFDEFGKVMRDANGRETWEGGRDALADWRRAGEDRLGSVVVEPGAGHFAWSERNAKYLALFIRKAAAARIGPRQANDAKISICKPIDPATGWTTELAAIKDPSQAPSPAGKNKGDAKPTSWHFDEEIARATLAYHAGISGKQDQFIRWNELANVDAGVRYYLSNLKWIGPQTFEVHPVYAGIYPKKAANAPGPSWAQAGQAVGHSGAPIRVRPVGGSSIVEAGNHALRIRYDALAPASDAGRITFIAWSDGDAQFRHTEQVGMMPRGFKGLTRGKDQTITFAQPANLHIGDQPSALNASSDSGLPVEFYVASGPAVIENGKLRVAEVPARAKFPMTIKVVAWQFGSAIEPLVKTAAPVERSILLHAKD